MERILFDASLRALVLAALVGMVALFVLRHVRGRQAMWMSVVVGMLLMPLLHGILPPLTFNSQKPAPALVAQAFLPSAEIVRTTAVPVVVTDRPARAFPWLGVYYGIATLLLARVALGLWLTGRALRGARRVNEELWMHDDLIRGAGVPVSVEESDRVKVPVTCGFSPARVILPVNWRDWPAETLRVVLAHELQHAASRDLVTALVASINAAVFWFHPLAWWLKRHLAVLSEQSADERALETAPDAASYARVLVEMAANVDGHRGRMLWSGSAIAEQFISRRVKRILHVPVVATRNWIRPCVGTVAAALVVLVASFDPNGVRAQSTDHAGYNVPRESFDTSGVDPVALEAKLAADQEDEHTRMRLLNYYFRKGPDESRVPLIVWLIEHHPESKLHANFSSALHTQGPDGKPASAERRTETLRLWRAQVAAHPDDARVLINAARQPNDLRENLALTARAHAIDPAHYTRAWEMYVNMALLDGVAGQPPRDPATSAMVREQLLNSTDVGLVERMAREMVSAAVSYALTGRTLPSGNGVKLLARDLIRHGREIAPSNSAWDELDEGLKQLDLHPPTANNAQVTRLRIGGGVAARNLKSFEPPVKPEGSTGGTVQLQILIGTDGRVKSSTVISGPPRLVQTAQANVKTYEYSPVLLKGQAVETLTTVDITFR